jgi:dynein heavy chain, axonemal
MKIEELFGEISHESQEWIDGIASCIIRQCAYEDNEDYKWVIFDGPIDSLWLENLNSVLDDN